MYCSVFSFSSMNPYYDVSIPTNVRQTFPSVHKNPILCHIYAPWCTMVRHAPQSINSTAEWMASYLRRILRLSCSLNSARANSGLPHSTTLLWPPFETFASSISMPCESWAWRWQSTSSNGATGKRAAPSCILPISNASLNADRKLRIEIGSNESNYLHLVCTNSHFANLAKLWATSLS